MAPLLRVEHLRKEYRAGGRFLRPRAPGFLLQAELTFEQPSIVGVLGPNGSGKTTLFELITGSNQPTAGRVCIGGQDIHRVRRAERGRLARHYHQSYQLRRFRALTPDWMLEPAASREALVHLFDEPQFNTQDGYIGLMLKFFRELRRRDRLVFVCLHPNESWQLDLMRELSERYIFVRGGAVTVVDDFGSLLALPGAREYLGRMVE